MVLLLAVLIILSFLLWGEWFTEIFGQENAIQHLSSYGSWAWAFGMLLLIADLFLPLPGTIIMSALGYIYGPFFGGLLASLGNVLSGMLAYWLCRSIGRKGARWILGEKDLLKGEALFQKQGGWIVAISRWLPIIPELVACMAGLNQMRAGTFFTALICGSIPLGFVFAYIGYEGIDNPTLAIILSAVLPAILWLIAQQFLRKAIYAPNSGD